MRAGNLRERVTIQQEVKTDNGQGGFVSSWQNVSTVFAEVTGLSAIEALKQSNIERSIVQWKVRLRSGSGVTAKHRLLWNGQTLNVLGVMQDPLEPKIIDFLHCQTGE